MQQVKRHSIERFLIAGRDTRVVLGRRPRFIIPAYHIVRFFVRQNGGVQLKISDKT